MTLYVRKRLYLDVSERAAVWTALYTLAEGEILVVLKSIFYNQ